jgi:hypothetical protein
MSARSSASDTAQEFPRPIERQLSAVEQPEPLAMCLLLVHLGVTAADALHRDLLHFFRQAESDINPGVWRHRPVHVELPPADIGIGVSQPHALEGTWRP